MSVDPQNDAVEFYQRGCWALDSGDAVEALECLSRSIELRPDVAAGYRRRASALAQLGRRPEAVADLDKAIRLKPEDPAAYAERAELRFRQHDFEGAIADCNHVLTLDSGWSAVLGIRGRAHAALGNSQAAIHDLQAASQADPVHALEYQRSLAELLLDCGQPRQAIEVCTTILSQSPEHVAALRCRGQAFIDCKEYETAEADLTAALLHDSSDWPARITRASARYHLQQWDEALADLDEAIRIRPRVAAAYSLRSACLEAMEDFDRALEEVNHAIRLQPSSTELLLRRANLHLRMGAFSAAISDALVLVDREPDEPAGFNLLGWAWSMNPDPTARNGERAREAATRACELTRWQNPVYLDTLAAASAICGDFEQAIHWASQAIPLADHQLAEPIRTRLEDYRHSKLPKIEDV